MCSIGSSRPPLTSTEVSFRKFELIDIDSFCDDLRPSDLFNQPSVNLDEQCSSYGRILKDTLDHHAPLHTKTMVVRPRIPWFNRDLREAKRQRRKAEKKWRHSKSDVDFRFYKKQ